MEWGAAMERYECRGTKKVREDGVRRIGVHADVIASTQDTESSGWDEMSDVEETGVWERIGVAIQIRGS